MSDPRARERPSKPKGPDGARERQEPRPQERGDSRGPRPAEEGGRERRKEGREEVGKEQKPRKPAEDQEAWLDSLIADCTDTRASGGAVVPPREKIPKRPSSRADSRPKGDLESATATGSRRGGEAAVPRPEAPSDHRPERPSRPPGAPGGEERPSRPTGEGAGRRAAPPAAPAAPTAPAPATNGSAAAASAPSAPTAARPAPMGPAVAPALREPPVPHRPPVDKAARPSRPAASQKEVPLSEPVDEVVVQERPPRAPARSSKPQQAADHIEEEIATVPVPPPDKSKAHEVDEEIEYGDDFEAAEDEEEHYQPQVRASPSPPPAQAIRPSSSSGLPPSRAMSPSIQERPEVAMADIKKAMANENEKLAKRQLAPEAARGKKGFLADYESTMPKFNLSSSSSPSEKASLARLNELKRLKIFQNRQVEKTDLFQQRPTKDTNMFLAGKSLKYCNLKSTSSQTGDDDVEAGVMTDDIWMDEKDMQFPTLTMGQGTKSGSEASQMLPFLRRVLPLFEASIVETQRRQGAGGSSRGGGDQGSMRAQACFALAESFMTGFLGAGASIVDIAICPQWYGADHALVLFTWPEVKKPPPSVGSSLDVFMRPIRSIVGLFPILSSGGVESGGNVTRPVRCLYSFCRLGSLTVVSGRPHLIVAGSEMGSLLVFDLRAKARSPAALTSVAGREAEDIQNSDPEIAHFEAPIWLVSVFTTDLFAFSTAQRAERDLFGLDDDDGLQLGGLGGPSAAGGGVHCVEICCIRCSDIAGGDALIFALDAMGVVSFWRALEAAVGGHSTKLALQGSVFLATGAHLLGDFLSASYLCIHPQQQARFVVVSTSGVRQANRGVSSSIADGPSALDLVPFRDEEMPGNFLSQPCCAAFSPFFPGLLLVAYAEGDLALFDCSMCVPITHWSGAVTKAPSRSISLAWSPRRPCVFFVKCEDSLDVWDLAEKAHSPVQSLDLGSQAAGNAASLAVSSDLFVGADGRPVVGVGGSALVIGLPSALTTPLQIMPQQHHQEETPLEELLVAGYEKTHLFPTLARHCRSVDVPGHCLLERDLLRRILAGVHPMQAWA